jgi:hypothetical protein
MSKPRNETLLQCPLPPREALRRAMMIEPPMDWKKAKKTSKPSKKKAAH